MIKCARGGVVMLAGRVAGLGAGIEGAPVIAAVLAALAVTVGFSFGLGRVVLRPLLGRPVVAGAVRPAWGTPQQACRAQ